MLAETIAESQFGEDKALVSKKCLEKGWTIRWLYREQTERKEDSGWRLFEGTESEEYNNDPSNVKIIDVYYLCEKDPTLISIFKNDYESAFEREDKSSPWVEIKDWHTD